MAMGEMVKISFRVDPDIDIGIVGESLWAERVGADRFRLANTPFHVRGVSYRDVVFARRRGRRGVLRFAGVSLRGGHSTIWIVLRVDRNEEVFQRRWAQLHELGCRYESFNRFLAVDVPPATDFRAVEDLSEAGFVAKVWYYEIANCGHFAAEGRRGDAP